MIQYLPHVNVTLNATALTMLVFGLILIKRGQVQNHKRVMIGAFCVSVLFLVSYVTYHYEVGDKKFPREDYSAIYSTLYYVVLASHIPLAAVTPFLAGTSIYLGLADKRESHRKLVRWTYPIWVYVSMTGILIYLMLYWWFPPLGEPQTFQMIGCHA